MSEISKLREIFKIKISTFAANEIPVANPGGGARGLGPPPLEMLKV